MTMETAKRMAHFNALLSWNGAKSFEEATEISVEYDYDKLDGKSYAESSIIAAEKGIRKHLLNGDESVDWSTVKFAVTDEIYDAIVQILIEIHDNWVKNEAKKYSRKSLEEAEEKLFQHLPTALIGIEEATLDL